MGIEEVVVWAAVASACAAIGSAVAALTSLYVACVNLTIRDREGKRKIIREFIFRWWNRGQFTASERFVVSAVRMPSALRALLREVYMAFSDSPAVRNCLRGLCTDIHNRDRYNKLLRAVCRSARVKYDKDLLDESLDKEDDSV